MSNPRSAGLGRRRGGEGGSLDASASSRTRICTIRGHSKQKKNQNWSSAKKAVMNSLHRSRIARDRQPRNAGKGSRWRWMVWYGVIYSVMIHGGNDENDNCNNRNGNKMDESKRD
ncbi:hypothetical protein BJX96DRAFT_152251 [Aspergillus floccosus]